MGQTVIYEPGGAGGSLLTAWAPALLGYEHCITIPLLVPLGEDYWERRMERLPCLYSQP